MSKGYKSKKQRAATRREVLKFGLLGGLGAGVVGAGLEVAGVIDVTGSIGPKPEAEFINDGTQLFIPSNPDVQIINDLEMMDGPEYAPYIGTMTGEAFDLRDESYNFFSAGIYEVTINVEAFADVLQHVSGLVAERLPEQMVNPHQVNIAFNDRSYAYMNSGSFPVAETRSNQDPADEGVNHLQVVSTDIAISLGKIMTSTEGSAHTIANFATGNAEPNQQHREQYAAAVLYDELVNAMLGSTKGEDGNAVIKEEGTSLMISSAMIALFGRMDYAQYEGYLEFVNQSVAAGYQQSITGEDIQFSVGKLTPQEYGDFYTVLENANFNILHIS